MKKICFFIGLLVMVLFLGIILTSFDDGSTNNVNNELKTIIFMNITNEYQSATIMGTSVIDTDNNSIIALGDSHTIIDNSVTAKLYEPIGDDSSIWAGSTPWTGNGTFTVNLVFFDNLENIGSFSWSNIIISESITTIQFNMNN